MESYSESINMLIHRCHEQCFSLIRLINPPDEEFVQIGIGTRQGVILKMLLRDDGITQKELTSRLHITSSSCGEWIGKLVENKFVERQANAADKRTVNLHLTESGRAVAMRYREKSKPVLEEWASDLTNAEQEQLFLLLGKFSEGLEKRIVALSQEPKNQTTEG